MNPWLLVYVCSIIHPLYHIAHSLYCFSVFWHDLFLWLHLFHQLMLQTVSAKWCHLAVGCRPTTHSMKSAVREVLLQNKHQIPNVVVKVSSVRWIHTAYTNCPILCFYNFHKNSQSSNKCPLYFCTLKVSSLETVKHTITIHLSLLVCRWKT